MNYRLDLVTLLRMLSQSTGVLEAHQVQISGVRGRSEIHLQIHKGTIVACSISDKNGSVRFSQREAFERIKHLILEWHYSEVPPPKEESPHRLPVPVSSTWLRRARQVSQQEFLTWPRLYRSIFSLTSQPITLERIITMLGGDQKPEQIREAIRYLALQGILKIENGPRTDLFT